MPNSLAIIRTGVGILSDAPARKPAAMTLALAVALAAGFFSVPPAEARPEMAGQNAEARFTAMDANKDGKLSREEFFAAQPQMKEGAFAAIDKDNDGFISLEEWLNFAAGHGKEGGMSSLPPSSAGHAPKGSSGAAPAPGAAPGGSGQPPALIMPPRDPK